MVVLDRTQVRLRRQVLSLAWPAILEMVLCMMVGIATATTVSQGLPAGFPLCPGATGGNRPGGSLCPHQCTGTAGHCPGDGLVRSTAGGRRDTLSPASHYHGELAGPDTADLPGRLCVASARLGGLAGDCSGLDLPGQFAPFLLSGGAVVENKGVALCLPLAEISLSDKHCPPAQGFARISPASCPTLWRSSVS